MEKVVIALDAMGGDYAPEQTVKGAVEATVAALIGMIPEGLYLLTSVAIAVGVLRLSRRKVLVRDMNCGNPGTRGYPLRG